jgi:HlyD family secretion protein
MKWRWLWLFAVVCVLGAAARWWPVAEAKGPKYLTYALQRGDILVAVNATGTIEPLEVVDVGAQIIGMIKEFGSDPASPSKPVDFGTHVAKGTVLARIDDATYQGELAKAQANLKLAEAEKSKAQAQLGAAEKDWNRTRGLKENTSRRDYDHAETAFKVAQADLAVAQARLEQAHVTERLAQTNLGYTVIRSPIDGIVIDRRVDVGQTVVAGLNAPSLFLLAKDLSKMRIRAQVNEADIGKIRVGQTVYFTVDAYPDRKFRGGVAQIRLDASIANSVVTYDVIVDIDNSDGLLLPYMTANAKFVVGEVRDVFRVPEEALTWRGDGSTLWWRNREGELQPVHVKSGLADGAFIAVSAPQLEAGMALVVGEAQRQEKDFGSTILRTIRGG